MSASSARVVLITGTSSGIGRETALLFARSGARVFGTVRLRDQPLDGVQLLEVDVRDDAGVARAVREVAGRAGRLDVLVNNAGASMVGAVEETSTKQAQDLFDANFFGAMRFTNAALPIMRAQRSGRIVHISSVLGFLPAPFMGLYAATKHALEAFSESLDHEVRMLGVRSVLIEPGFTRTALDRNGTSAAHPLDEAYGPVRDAVRGQIARNVEGGDDPGLIAETILRAATDRRPRLRYPVGKRAMLLSRLRSFVPARQFDSSLRKSFGLPPG